MALWHVPNAHAQILPVTLQVTAGDYSETLTAADLASWFYLETQLGIETAKRSEVENTNYCPTDPLYCDLSLSRATRLYLSVHLESTVNHQSVENFVTTLATRVNQEPQDASFDVDGSGQIIIGRQEKLGRKLKENESTALMLRALQGESPDATRLTLTTEVTAPKIVGADREKLGLKELVGEGRTNFQGSPHNRLFNIKRALEQFQNILIAPGEEFSFVEYLGAVDSEHGYLPELVIKYNKTEPEFGGGICQVSSTVFRAAIYSGLKITERRQHAYAVQYYKPYGMDATIYIPKPDLKFTNNTPSYILMQSTIDGDNLTFRFFGTKDGRTVTIDGPHILERGSDGSMKTVFTQEVTDSTGQNFIRDSFWSNYKSPSLFPHPGQEPVYTSKPKDWSERQWKEYRAISP
ncbi:MAG: VanW family protein [Candidatus Moranbacteria bacterium]|nr:VanW family protein [Candidatus Moranbacteria bacterium]